MENERWLWTPNGELRLWTPNRDNGFERQIEKWLRMPNERRMMALNAKTKLGLRTPKWRTNDGSKRQTGNYGSERQTETMALNAKLKKRLWTLNGRRMMALNAKTKLGLWTPKWRTNDGSERQTGNYGSERQTETMTLNAKLKKRLWTPNRRRIMALNAKPRQWLWTPNWKSGSECQAESTTLNSELKRWLWTPNRKNVALKAKLNRIPMNVKLRRNDSKCRNREWHGGSERRTAREWWGGNMPQCSIGCTRHVLMTHE